MNLIKSVKVILAKAGQSSAGTDVESDVIDMQGFEACAFVGTIATANAGNYAKVQQCDTSGGSYADLEGTKLVTGDNGDSFLIEVVRPRERFLKLYIERGGANTATGDVYAILSGAHKVPTTHGTTVDSELHISPAEGTA
jgi:hypothetical protein